MKRAMTDVGWGKMSVRHLSVFAGYDSAVYVSQIFPTSITARAKATDAFQRARIAVIVW
jgi:hypothetical protein